MEQRKPLKRWKRIWKYSKNIIPTTYQIREEQHADIINYQFKRWSSKNNIKHQYRTHSGGSPWSKSAACRQRQAGERKQIYESSQLRSRGNVRDYDWARTRYAEHYPEDGLWESGYHHGKYEPADRKSCSNAWSAAPTADPLEESLAAGRWFVWLLYHRQCTRYQH